MESKFCFKCGNEKPLEDFYKHAMMKDGRLNKCKQCCKEAAISNRKKNLGHYREYDRRRGNRQSKEYIREYRTKYPKKYKAVNMVNNAIRAGNLVSMPCEVCGDETTHAHHDDYDKPLNVRWLCPAHHKQWHDKNGEGRNAR